MSHSSALKSLRVTVLGKSALPPDGAVFDGRLGDGTAVVIAVLDGSDALARAHRALEVEHVGIARSLDLIELPEGPALIQECAVGPVATVDALGGDAVEAVENVFATLDFAHSRGLTHGDLRADDLRVTPSRMLTIQRFGFTRPSRPPAPRYDLLAASAILAPLLPAGPLRDIVAAATGDAATIRRDLRDARSNRPTPPPRKTPSSNDGAVVPVVELDPELLIGRTLGEFTITRKLGEGGLGMVFRAHQRSLARDAVIKIPFSRGGSVSAQAARRFLAEARLASSLDHPYAAHIYAFGQETDGLMWIAMELVDGTPLDAYLRKTGPMPVARAVAFVERLTQVVHRAHELGIVHRDVKPSNVMVLQRSGRLLPKLLDFGIARLVNTPGSSGSPFASTLSGEIDPDQRLTADGAIVGSPLYMAPEQWADSSAVGPGADIYALGILTYELLVGRPPFLAKTLAALAVAHANEPVPSLPADIPRELDAAVARALAKHAPERFATAVELGAALTASTSSQLDTVPLPSLPEVLRGSLLATAPAPIADSIAAFDAARNPHQALASLDQLVTTIANLLGVLALAARSRLGPHADESERVGELIRELGRRTLDATEWHALARELCKPYDARPELHPVGELVELVRGDALDRLIATRAGRPRALDDAAARRALETELEALTRVLTDLEFLAHFRIVVGRDGAAIAWMGSRREAYPTVTLHTPIDDGDTWLVDGDGVPVLRLRPLVEVAPPMPGQPELLFLCAGSLHDVGRLVAAPSGFAIARSEVAVWLRRQLADDDTSVTDEAAERPPFLGLSAFTADDAATFFGREREIDVCVNRLRVQGLVAVVGRSGSGKSSFVHAGVVPSLPPGWMTVTMRPGPAPMEALRARLTPVLGRLPDGTPEDVAAALQRAVDATEQTLVIVIDQFEEVFTLCRDPDERGRFASVLANFAGDTRGAVRVLVTMRDDFLIAAEELAVLAPGLMLLAAPKPSELERILREPILRRGYVYDDPELPARMVREVAGQPGALPMLSFAAAHLWNQRDRHFRRLLVSSYDAMGGVTGALVGHAEAMLADLTAAERELVREVFRRLVTVEGTRAVVSRSELAEVLGKTALATSIVDKLIASRLVVASEGDQLEIAHETLLVAWPRLVEWRREDSDGARLREQLHIAAEQWAARGRAEGLLWRGDAVTEYQLWRRRHPGALTDLEATFADASVADEQRRSLRRRGAVIAGFLVLVAVAIVLWSLNRRAAQATAETKDELVASLLAEARTKLIDNHHWEALDRIVQAQRLGASGPQIDLMRTLAREPARAMIHRERLGDGQLWSTRYSPDGNWIVATGDGVAVLLDAATATHRIPLVGHVDTVRDAVFDPSSHRVATAGFDGTVRIFEVPSGRVLQVLRGHDGFVRCVAWRRDGGMLVTSGDDETVRLWDPTTGEQRRKEVIKSAGTTCDFNEEIAVVGSRQGPIVLLPLDGPSRRLDGHSDWARSVQFDRTGTRLVSASADHTARIWDLVGEHPSIELIGFTDELTFAAFSPDGAHVAASSRDGSVRVWNAATGASEQTLKAHQGVAWYVEFSPDGQRLVSCGDDGVARIWNPQTGMPLSSLEGHSRAILRASFAPSGTRLATASYDGELALWDATRTPVVVDRPGTAHNCDVETSLERTAVAVVCEGHEGEVWDLRSHHSVMKLPSASHTAIADGVVVVAEGTSVQIFELPSGRPLTSLATHSRVVALGASIDRIAIADDDGLVQFVTPAGTPRYSLPLSSVSMLAPFSDDRWLVRTGGELHVYAGVTRIARATVGSASGLIATPVLSPSRRWLVTTGTSSTWLFDTTNAAAFVQLAHGRAATSLAAFDPTSRRLVVTSTDGSAVIWDIERRAVVGQLVSYSQHLADVTFDDSGRLIAAIDGAGSVQWFDAEQDRARVDEVYRPRLLGITPGRARLSVLLERARDGTLTTFNAAGDLIQWRIPIETDTLEAAERDLACNAPPDQRKGECR